MRFHAHKWEQVGEQFNPPHDGLKSIKFYNDKTGLMATYGFTVVTYRCSRCPQRRFDEVVGRTVDAS